MDKTEQWANLHGRAEATVEVLSIQRAELVELWQRGGSQPTLRNLDYLTGNLITVLIKVHVS